MLPTTKKLQFAIEFNRFCNEFGIPAADLSQMIVWATKHMNAWVSQNNTGRDTTKLQNRASERLDEYAAKYGCTVEFSGLWATIVKGTMSRHLPS